MTLIEVLISTFILCISVTVSTHVIYTFIAGEKIVEQKLIAKTLAEGLMNEILTRPHDDGFFPVIHAAPPRTGWKYVDRYNTWTSPENSDGYYQPVYPHYPGTNAFIGGLQNYKRVVGVSGAANVADITVTVYFDEDPTDGSDGKELFKLTAHRIATGP